MVKKKVKIGFDLDGVILYNPIRFLRPIAKSLKFVKPLVFHQKKEPFYFPKSRVEKLVWKLIHKSSFKVDPYFGQLKQLVDESFIEAYLVSGRYSILEEDYQKWLKKIGGTSVFVKTYMNKNDIQPNLFKEEMIKKLGLDFYVEDNWDIIQKLNHHTDARILWITNFFDSHIPYPYKFINLKGIIKFLKEENFSN